MRTVLFLFLATFGFGLFLGAASPEDASKKLAEEKARSWSPSSTDSPRCISGVYPRLAVFNAYGECGIGAIAPWAGRLWFVTYPPHFPEGSGDRLYTVSKDLRLEIRPESVGGTDANRMIHDESHQLIIGPHFIDEKGNVRTADIHQLKARLSANARHLTDPANKVYFFGMERELYEVDVHSLEVKKIYGLFGGPFPGYHGKGAITAQGHLIVANNGERGWDIKKDPHLLGPSGVLAESDGKDWSQPWKIVERTSFTELSSPSGIHSQPVGDDRVWALGWDQRSVLLKTREAGEWHTFRLPKGSYTQDARHGWYTEWPRIREVTDGHFLMHMHGMFYDFPKTFSAANSGGLEPLSTFHKMPVDYCAWQGRLVMSCDDDSIMDNELGGQSNSNLRFTTLKEISQYGAPAGWGGVWVNDSVKAGKPSDPFLVNGFLRSTLHFRNDSDQPVTVTVEDDDAGEGKWHEAGALGEGHIIVPARSYAWKLTADFEHLRDSTWPQWQRLRVDHDVNGMTAYYHLENPPRPGQRDFFKDLADVGDAANSDGGYIKPADKDARTLLYAAAKQDGWQLCSSDGSLTLKSSDDAGRLAVLREKYGVSKQTIAMDKASVIISEGPQHRYRLPKTDPAYDKAFPTGWPRTLREVVTERFLLNAHGTFYEIPRASAGGVKRMRPIATHRKAITDFCSWRGLLVMTGVKRGATESEHLVRGAGTALWVGDVDDLWKFGAPVGEGGPWQDSAVKAGEPSDPYLMTGYDRKHLTLTHQSDKPVTFTVEVDFLGDDSWNEYGRFTVIPKEKADLDFPSGFSAHWVRVKADADTRATAHFIYSTSAP
jgi:hypothetical protein